MPQGLTVPYSFSAETPANADQVNANFAAVQAKFNGGIVDGDLSSAADLDGNKLSQASGKQVPTAALANNAVTQAKLSSDAAQPGVDANRAVTGAHIAAVDATNLKRFLPTAAADGSNAIPLNKLGIVAHLHTSGLSGVGASPGANNYTITPVTNFPVATYQCIGAYVLDLVVNSGTVGPYVVGILMNDTTTNWNGVLTFYAASPGGNITVKAMLVFIPKT